MTNNVPRLGIAFGVAALLVVASSLSANRLVFAQPEGADDNPRFTGRSTSLDAESLRVSHRWFEAGARSAWHRHTHGQLLFVAEGRARTQKRGAAMREMGVGESDYTGPNVVHWHGATPDVEFTQIAVSFGDGTDWFEKVTDDEYSGR